MDKLNNQRIVYNNVWLCVSVMGFERGILKVSIQISENIQSSQLMKILDKNSNQQQLYQQPLIGMAMVRVYLSTQKKEKQCRLKHPSFTHQKNQLKIVLHGQSVIRMDKQLVVIFAKIFTHPKILLGITKTFLFQFFPLFSFIRASIIIASTENWLKGCVLSA